MIITQIIGGLGNQLFQYAFGRSLAIKLNTDLKLDITGFETYNLHAYSLMHFNIIERFAHPDEIKKYTCSYHNKAKKIFCRINRKVSARHYLKESTSNFDQRALNYPDNSYITGYWGSEKYFIAIEPIIRNEFKLKTPLSAHSLKIAELIKQTNAVSIHLRRGDFVTVKETNKFHGTCSLEYYAKAIKIINERVMNPFYFIFSDDIKYAKDNLTNIPNLYFVEHNDARTNYEDLYLMSQCKNNIIANSTFSWWGAWLNKNPGKIVIAPEKWLNDTSINTNDVIPESWIKIQK